MSDGTGESRRTRAEASAISGVAAVGGLRVPGDRLRIVAQHAGAARVARAQRGHRAHIAGLGGLLVPAACIVVVLPHILAAGVHRAQLGHGARITSLGAGADSRGIARGKRGRGEDEAGHEGREERCTHVDVLSRNSVGMGTEDIGGPPTGLRP
jgi:hypothetical protein